MFKALLKKQFKELGQAWFRNSKKGKPRTPGSVAGLILLYIFAFVSLGILFVTLSLTLASTLLPPGLDWMYFALLGLIAVLFGVFGSVFNTYASLYSAKDNELLLAMPIPPMQILATRMLGVFVMGLFYESLVMLPAVIVYWIFVPVTLARVLCPLALILLMGVFILTLSLVLGWVVALIAARLKNKSFITVFVSLGILAAYYLFYFKAMRYFQEFSQHVDALSHTMKTGLYPFYQMGMAGAGNLLSLLIVALAVLALFALVCWVLARSFLRLVTTHRGEKKAVYREKTVKASSARAALLRRELKHFTSSAAYMLNCSLGTVLMLLLAGTVLVKAGDIRPVIRELDGSMPVLARTLPIVAAGLLCSIVSMNDLTAPSVSLEGKGIWLAQSLPVPARDILDAKQRMHILLTLPVALLMTLSVCVVLGFSVLEVLLVTAVVTALVLLCASFGLMLNLLRPNLDWTSESYPIKQGLNVFLALFVGSMVGGLTVGVYYLLYYLADWHIPVPVYLLVVLILLAAAAALCSRWLRRKGARIFETL